MISRKTVHAYVQTLLWSETFQEDLEWEGTTYKEGTPLEKLFCSGDNCLRDVVGQAEEDLASFRAVCVEDLGIDPFQWFPPEDVARNFALSRNGHGAGFFDSTWVVKARLSSGARFEVEKDLADDLQDRAKWQGSHNLHAYVQDGDLCVDGLS